MSIVFDKNLETGNETIDTQHRELIARVNKLTEDCAVGREKNVAVQTLDFLMDYTDFHFKDEEKLQEEKNYPLLAAHRDQHGKFVKAVEELREMLEEEEGPTEAIAEAVKKIIVDWLLDHILVWAKQLALYVKEY